MITSPHIKSYVPLLIIMQVGILLTLLNATMLDISLPKISSDFSISNSKETLTDTLKTLWGVSAESLIENLMLKKKI